MLSVRAAVFAARQSRNIKYDSMLAIEEKINEKIIAEESLIDGKAVSILKRPTLHLHRQLEKLVAVLAIGLYWAHKVGE